MRKWYFPYGKDIEKESVNNARIETFKDNPLESLARETAQNSIDANLDKNKPVHISFKEKYVDTNTIPDIKTLLNNVIPKARETWSNDDNAQKFLDKYEKVLKSDKIKVLKISDYNTTGLEGARWESLIEKAGTSIKDDVSSAGSFGIGKAAPFATSDLRMVFYSTKIKNNVEKSIGVLKFISYDRDDGTTAQGVGYLGSYGKEPMLKQIQFNFGSRDEIGTDIYIIGFNQDDSWTEYIKNSILENFLVSLYQEKITATVQDIEINKSTMHKLISSLSGKKYDRLKNYYSVLIDKDVKKLLLDKRFEKYGFKPEDGKLYLSKVDRSSKIKANRSILMTRKAGMKIFDRKNISGSIQFNGIFQAIGDKINKILKEMENPNHTDWIAERYEDKKKAQNLLDDIYHFIKENVVYYYQESIEKQVDAFGISDFLPNKLSDEDVSGDMDQGLISEIENIKLVERDVKNVVLSQELGEYEIENILTRSGIIDGEYGGEGRIDRKTNNPFGKDSKSGVGEEEGTRDIGESDLYGQVLNQKKFKKSNKFSARLIEVDYKNGDYKLLVLSEAYHEKIKIELTIIGESGSSYVLNILNATRNKEKIYFKKNAIIVNNIDKGINEIMFKLDLQVRVRMGVKIYEYR